MPRLVSTYEAKAHLSAFIAEVMRTGEAVIITRHGKPVARLVPEPPAGDPADALADLRRRACEEGLSYDWEEVNRPLGEEAWGDSELWPDLDGDGP